jgi:hypothetical protein
MASCRAALHILASFLCYDIATLIVFLVFHFHIAAAFLRYAAVKKNISIVSHHEFS